MPFCIAATAALLFGTLIVAAPKAENKTPLKGAADDSHGNLNWKSQADRTPDSDEWTFQKCVTNRSTNRNCRITWANGENKVSSLLKSDTTKKIWETSLETTPEKVDGHIKFNGGTEAGDGTGEAPSWLPITTKISKKTSTKTSLSFADGDEIHDVEIEWASRKLGEGGQTRIEYTVTAKSSLPSSTKALMTIDLGDSVGIRAAIKTFPKVEPDNASIPLDNEFFSGRRSIKALCTAEIGVEVAPVRFKIKFLRKSEAVESFAYILVPRKK